jgi:hypothetical protein
MLKFAITISSVIGVLGNTCQTVCDSLTGCESSYCVYTPNGPFCSGLFYTDSSMTHMCVGGTENCTSDLLPVPCPTESNICDVVCASTELCSNRGSYCKYWQTIPVCYGLYYTDSSRTSTCFHIGTLDDTCAEEFPVGCHSGTILDTRAGESITVARVDIEIETTTEANELLGPEGVFTGQREGALSVSVRVEFHPTRSSLDVSFTITTAQGSVVIEGADVRYHVEGQRIVVEDCEGTRQLLANFSDLEMSQINISFNETADQVNAVFGRLRISAQKI